MMLLLLVDEVSVEHVQPLHVSTMVVISQPKLGQRICWFTYMELPMIADVIKWLSLFTSREWINPAISFDATLLTDSCVYIVVYTHYGILLWGVKIRDTSLSLYATPMTHLSIHFVTVDGSVLRISHTLS